MRLPPNLLGPPRTFYRIPLDPLHTLNRSRPPTLPIQSLYRPSTDPQPLTNLLEAFHKASTDRITSPRHPRHPRHPLQPHSATQGAGERAADAAAGLAGLPTNPLGPLRTFYRIPLDPLHTFNRFSTTSLKSLYIPINRFSTSPLQTL